MKRRLVIVALSVFWCLNASASNVSEMQREFEAGHYDRVVELAGHTSDVDQTLLASEALLTKILLGESDNPKHDAKRAMQLVNPVIAKTPQVKEALFLSALAYGYYGRSVGALEAWRTNLPVKIKNRIDTAIQVLPDDPRTKAMLGAWHLSVRYKAGAKTARKKYGATEKDGWILMRAAHRAAPKDIFIAANYATMLYVLSKGRERAQVETLLGAALAEPPADYSQKRLQAILREFQAALDHPKRARKLAKKFLDW